MLLAHQPRDQCLIELDLGGWGVHRQTLPISPLHLALIWRLARDRHTLRALRPRTPSTKTERGRAMRADLTALLTPALVREAGAVGRVLPVGVEPTLGRF